MLNLRLTRGFAGRTASPGSGNRAGRCSTNCGEKARGLPPQLLRTEEDRLAFTPEGFLVSNALLVALE